MTTLSEHCKKAADARWRPAMESKKVWIGDALGHLMGRVCSGRFEGWKHSDHLADLRRSVPPFCYQQRPGHWEALRKTFIAELEAAGLCDIVKRN